MAEEKHFTASKEYQEFAKEYLRFVQWAIDNKDNPLEFISNVLAGMIVKASRHCGFDEYGNRKEN